MDQSTDVAGTEQDQVAQAGVARPNEVGTLIEGMVQRIGSSADARAVYGEPIQRNGLTIVPVAKVRYGFGGGGGRNQKREGQGLGAGGGANVSPVGFIVIRDGGAKFQRIRMPSPLLRGALVFLAVWAVRRVLARA